MKRCCIIFVLVFFSGLQGINQNHTREADSVLHLLKASRKEDTLHVNLLLTYHKYIYVTKPDTAFLLSQQAIRISEKLNYYKGIVRAYSNQAVALWYKNENDQAVRVFHEAIDRADKYGQLDWKSRVYSNFGLFYLRLVELDSAEFYFLASIAVAKKLSEPELMAKPASDLGLIYLYRGNYMDAAKYLLDARENFGKTNDKTNLIYTLIKLGMLFSELSDFERSLMYFREAMEINKLNKDPKVESLILTNLGILYYMVKKDYDTATIHLGKALYLARMIPDNQLQVLTIRANLGIIAVIERQFTYAEKILSEVYKDLYPLKRGYELTGVVVNLGYAYQGLKKYDLAEKYAQEALKLAYEFELNNFKKTAFVLLDELATIRGDFKNAFLYKKKVDEVNDSIKNEDIIKKIAEASFDIQLKEKEIQHLLLNKDNHLQRTQIYKQRITLVIATGILILLTILIYTLQRNQRLLKQLNNTLDARNRQLQESNQSRDKFFSVISHDLRSPFNAFLNLTNIMNQEFKNMSREEISNFNEVMKTSAIKLFKLLENLLEWSKMQRGMIQFNPEIINLKTTTAETINLMTDIASKKSIELKSEIPDDIEVVADNNMLNTILRNLISNSIKFTPEKGQILVGAEVSSSSQVLVKVKDTGIGMSLDIMEKLFQLNGNATRQGTAGEPGSGMGLMLCHEFVEKNGGKIWVESETGIGTTFFFTISTIDNQKKI